METMDQKEIKKSTRRSKKVKNLEEEVEFIFSQDESDEDVKENVEEILPKTPSRRERRKNTATTPKASSQTSVLQEILQTPRRSCRKSVRPAQEYDDIVNKSCSRSAKKHLLINEEVDIEENVGNQDEITLPKWTPAKVGRVSQKRTRKSRRNDKGKNKDLKEDEEDEKAAIGKVKKQKKEIKVQEEKNTKGEEDQEDVILELDKKEEKEQMQGQHEEIASQDQKKELFDKEEKNKKVEDQEDIRFADVILQEDKKEEKEQSEGQDEERASKDQHKEPIDEEKQFKEDPQEVQISEQVSVVDIKKNEDQELPKKYFVEERTDEKKEELEINVDNIDIANEESEHMDLNGDHEDKVIAEQTEKIDPATEQIAQTLCSEMEHHEDPIQLILEDSEDCKEFEQNAQDEEICIVFENNISNKEELEDKETTDNFGSYLKQKKINISDLGLNLLKDEEEEKDIMVVDDEIKTTEDVEDMPSLIVCDDEDDGDEKDGKSSIKLNETFEATDATETITYNTKPKSIDDENEIVKIIESSENQNEEIMETLQMSDDDDGETPRKPPRVQKDTPLRQQTILSSLKESALKINPKDIVLRGIRKRSLSVCINGNEQTSQKLLAGPLAKAKQERMVSFYSPANQHTIIEDLDKMIAKSLKKQKLQENKDISNKFVTTRRKRSISLDESTMSTSQISKLPRPVLNQNLSGKTQTSTSTSKTLSRTKLPNFASIHEKQFKKMESLVDHVSRKQERSKNLINSATKLKPVSAQKNMSIIKNSNNIVNEKPKALKKINLGVNTTTQMNKSQLNTTTTSNLNKTQEVKVVNLPDPRLANNNKPKTSGTISRRAPQTQSIRNYLKPSQTTNIEKARVNTKAGATKPTFNLSTSLMVKPSTSFAEKSKLGSTKPTFNLSTSLMMKPATSSTNVTEKANASYMSNEDKMASRLQRHMDLFKGRVPSTRAGVASRRNETLLKGVRSNRRFELQMQHRKNLE